MARHIKRLSGSAAKNSIARLGKLAASSNVAVTLHTGASKKTSKSLYERNVAELQRAFDTVMSQTPPISLNEVRMAIAKNENVKKVSKLGYKSKGGHGYGGGRL